MLKFDADNQGNAQKQLVTDYPDIVARVFNEKKDALLAEIKKGLFCAISGLVYTTEFQKRGLPHVHLLIFLQTPFKIRDLVHVNSIVSAKLPDPNLHSNLWNAVTELMLHNLYGATYPNAPCMQDGKCSKQYPMPFNPETQFGNNGYPNYA